MSSKSCEENLSRVRVYLTNKYGDLKNKQKLRKKGATILSPRNEIPCYIISLSKPETIDDLLKFLIATYSKEQTSTKNTCVLGLDCEFSKKKVGTIQLSTRSLSCVFQMTPILNATEGVFPQSLLNILQNPSIIKCGVDIHNDRDKILQTFPQVKDVDSLVDMSDLAIKEGITNGDYRSLKDFAKELMDLPNVHTPTDWKTEVLSDASVRYAGIDAYTGFRTAEILFEHLGINQLFFDWIQSFVTKSKNHKTELTIDQYKVAKGMKEVAQRARLMSIQKKTTIQNALEVKKRKRAHESNQKESIDNMIQDLKSKKAKTEKQASSKDDGIMLNIL
ncbi:EXD2 [Acrasis kona]|uniref:3'-5' exonuclease n=1 Tax=Acrasis kona TaxID=1008807 RepID=A0AAW2YUZ3_9EUKA